MPPPVLDGEFFTEESDLGLGLLEARLERVSALGPASRIGDDDAGETDGVEDSRLDVIGPLAGESNGSGMWHAGLQQDVEPDIATR